jgi:hypothetical protein
MSGKAITVKYPEVAAGGGQIAGTPAFFHTDSDLEVQGLAVPKGDYVLSCSLTLKRQHWEQAGGHRCRFNPAGTGSCR